MGAMFAMMGGQIAEGVGSLMSGFQQNAVNRAIAAQSAMQQRQIELAGAKEAADIRASLADTISAQRAYFAASGIDISSGTPADLEARTRKEGQEALDISKINTMVGADAKRVEANFYKWQGRTAIFRGLLTAAGAIKGAGSPSVPQVNRSNIGPTGGTYASELAGGVRPI